MDEFEHVFFGCPGTSIRDFDIVNALNVFFDIFGFDIRLHAYLFEDHGGQKVGRSSRITSMAYAQTIVIWLNANHSPKS